MNDVEEVLSAIGVDFDQLTEEEKQTYFKWLEIAETSKITLDDFRKGIPKMRESVEFALSVHDLSPAQDLFLKARLRCYILMEGLLSKPERAKEMLEQYKRRAASKPVK